MRNISGFSIKGLFVVIFLAVMTVFFIPNIASAALLTGKTPANYNNSPPSGWITIRTQDFENGCNSQFENCSKGQTMVGGGTVHGGSSSLQGTYAKDGDNVEYITYPGAFTEIYLSWYDYTESQALFNDEYLLATFMRRTVPEDNLLQEVLVDFMFSGINSTNGDLQVVPQGEGRTWNTVNEYGINTSTYPVGQWVQWEVHYRPNTPGNNSDGFVRIYLNGTLFRDFENYNFNGSVSMNTLYYAAIGGLYTKLAWTWQDPFSLGAAACSGPAGGDSAIYPTFTAGKCGPSGNDAATTDGCRSYYDWPILFASPRCGPSQSSYKRFIDDIIVMKKEGGGTTPPPEPTPTPITPLTPIPSVGGTLCHLLTSSNQTPTGYGASYNPLTTAKELLMSVLCQSTSATITIGNNSNYQYIYNQGYIYKGGQWQQVTYNCSNLISNAWCVGNANATINLTSTELSSTNYILGYVCSWTPPVAGQAGFWQCGCRDNACSTNYWNLQEFKYGTAPTPTPTPNPSNTITIRARGAAGGETIDLRINGATRGTWTLSTTYQNYSVSVPVSNFDTVQVYFTNDNGGARDVQIDYAVINGTTYQAENMPTNTGIWNYNTNQCGGTQGEWINCPGYIQFQGAAVPTPTPTPTPTVTPTPTPTPTGTQDNPPTGWFDGADAVRAVGWVYDKDQGTNPTNIQILIDGVLKTTIPANTSRPDLVTAGVAPNANHGFDYAFSGLANGNHTITINTIDYPTGTVAQLGGSPRTITVGGTPTPTPTPILGGANPINLNATQGVRNVLNYLYNVRDTNKVLTAQHFAGNHYSINDSQNEAKHIYDLTGKWPAIMGADFGWNYAGVASSAQQYWASGGLITICWHETNPSTPSNGSGPWEEVILQMSQTDFNQVITPGTNLYNRWLAHIDLMAGYLKQLKDAGVVVLWRPYHEMQAGGFWWAGKTGSSYIQLWKNMYDRYTNYHGLNNLIWVWSPVSWSGISDGSSHFPGSNYVDVGGYDIYVQSQTDSTFSQKNIWARNIMGSKPYALTEVGLFPLSQDLANNFDYIYAMPWFGGWSDNQFYGAPSENGPGNNQSQLLDFYNNSAMITRDELPGF